MTGAIDATTGRPLTREDLQAILAQTADIDVIIEYLDKTGNRVTTARQPFPADTAQLITAVRLINEREEPI